MTLPVAPRYFYNNTQQKEQRKEHNNNTLTLNQQKPLPINEDYKLMLVFNSLYKLSVCFISNGVFFMNTTRSLYIILNIEQIIGVPAFVVTHTNVHPLQSIDQLQTTCTTRQTIEVMLPNNTRALLSRLTTSLWTTQLSPRVVGPPCNIPPTRPRTRAL